MTEPAYVMTTPMMVVLLVVVGGLVLYLIETLARRTNPLLLILVAGALLALWMSLSPSDGTAGDPRCPGYEIFIRVGDKCLGMDTDANVRWVADHIGVEP